MRLPYPQISWRAIAGGSALLIVLAVVAGASAESDELSAIRARVASYQEAYNRHDAAAVAEHWSEAATYVRESGERVRGRAAIQQVFEDLFAEDPELQLTVTVTDLRLITPDVAVEDGKVTIAREGADLESTYTAVNVKQNGTWYIDTVRETDLPTPPSHYNQLKQLGWMIGDWKSQEGDAAVTAKCEWSKNKNFITRQFSISEKDGLEVSGTQIIGWDAAAREIKSWMFDSDGGTAEGLWTPTAEGWSIKSSIVMSDGRTGSAVQLITYVNENEFNLQFVSRELDGEVLPNTAEIKVLRVTGQ